MVDYSRFDRIEELIDKIGAKEEKYRAILDASPWGILVVDQTFHIVFTNESFERMSGYRVDELVSKNMGMLIPERHKTIHKKHEKAYVKNPYSRLGNHGYQPILLTKFGSELPVEISLSPARVEGQQLFFASVRPLETLRDISEGHERGV